MTDYDCGVKDAWTIALASLLEVSVPHSFVLLMLNACTVARDQLVAQAHTFSFQALKNDQNDLADVYLTLVKILEQRDDAREVKVTRRHLYVVPSSQGPTETEVHPAS